MRKSSLQERLYPFPMNILQRYKRDIARTASDTYSEGGTVCFTRYLLISEKDCEKSKILTVFFLYSLGVALAKYRAFRLSLFSKENREI